MTKQEITNWLFRNIRKYEVRTVYDSEEIFIELYNKELNASFNLPNNEIYNALENFIKHGAKFRKTRNYDLGKTLKALADEKEEI